MPEPKRTVEGALALLCLFATIGPAFLAASDFALAGGDRTRTPSQVCAVAVEDYIDDIKEVSQPAEPPGPDTADSIAVEVAGKRALRWGGNWYMPMLVGQQTTPLVLQLAVAHALSQRSDPARAKRYLAALGTTCDFFVGCNALNMTWVTGLGPRHPVQVFHMDAWYNGKGRPHPSIIPYGPWRKQNDEGQGPWDVAWPHKTVYPPIDAWPGNERWFDNRCSPMNSEFTVHQNTAPAAALFGILCAPGLAAGD